MRGNTDKGWTYFLTAGQLLIVGTAVLVAAGCNRSSTAPKKGGDDAKKETVALKLVTKKMEIYLKMAEHLEKGEQGSIPPLRQELDVLETELNGLPIEEKLEAQRTIEKEYDAVMERLDKVQERLAEGLEKKVREKKGK